MSLIAIAVAVVTFVGVAIAIGLVILEANILHKKGKDSRRPSTVLSAVASFFRTTLFHNFTYFIGICADVFGFFRRIILLIRDKFFGWIPKAVFKQAIKDLRSAFGALFKTPFGLLEGLYDSISNASNPILAIVVLIINSGVVIMLLEILLYSTGFETVRPSAILGALANLIYNFCYGVMVFFSNFINIGDLVFWIVAFIGTHFFGWVDTTRLNRAKDDISEQSVKLSTSVYYGLVNGSDALNAKLVSSGSNLSGKFIVFCFIAAVVVVALLYYYSIPRLLFAGLAEFIYGPPGIQQQDERYRYPSHLNSGDESEESDGDSDKRKDLIDVRKSKRNSTGKAKAH